MLHDFYTCQYSFTFKIEGKRIFRFSMSEIEYTNWRGDNPTRHINLAILDRRREEVARQNEIGAGYW